MHEYLHKEKAILKEKKEKKEEIRKELDKLKTEKEKISHNSKILNNQVIIRKLANLFNELCKEETGILNANNLNLKALGEQQGKVFGSLISKIQKTKANLRLDDFVNKALDIWEALDFQNKIGVFKKGKRTLLFKSKNLSNYINEVIEPSRLDHRRTKSNAMVLQNLSNLSRLCVNKKNQ